MRNNILLATTHLFFFCLVGIPGFQQQLDPSFSLNGIAITPIGNTADRAIDMAIDNNNRIVTVGQTFNGTDNDIALIRYNTDGTPDNSFGNGGIVTTPVGNENDYSDGVAIQPDGKIVVCGYFDDGPSLLTIVLLRYNDDGTLDATFGGDGIVTFNNSEADDLARDVKIQADGKIVVTGSSFNGNNQDILLARFNEDGSPDLSFNGTGFILLPVGSSNDFAFQLAIQPDNKIVAAGYILTEDLSENIVMVRVNSNGSLDNNFGNAGISLSTWADPIYPSFDAAYTIALQDDKILLGGYARGLLLEVDNYIAVARYTNTGILDSGFANNGIFKTIFGPVNNFLAESVTALSVQQDGKIVASAHSSIIGFNADFLLFRLTANGALDNTFGGNGFISTALSLGDDLAGSVAIQADGKIVLAGYSFDSTRNYDFAVARYLPDSVGCGTPPNTLTSNISTSSATIRWKPLPGSIANYKIRYRIKNAATYPVRRVGSISSQLITNLSADTTYEWQVQADCGATFSSYSSVNTFKTKGTALLIDSHSNLSSAKSSGADVYPNPATNHVTITFNTKEQAACEVTLSDLQGRILLRMKSNTIIGSNRQSINISKFAPGIYILRIHNGQTTTIKRIVKQ